MITIELDSEGENRRGILKTYYSSNMRRVFLLLAGVFVLAINYLIFTVDAPISVKITRSLIASPCTVLVVWFLFSYRFMTTLGSFQQAHHVLSGSTTVFSYALTDEGALEKTESIKKIYPYAEYIGCKSTGSETWLSFSMGLIYLPKYAVKSGSVQEFIEQFEKKVNECRR